MNAKKLISGLLSAALCVSLALPVCAAEDGGNVLNVACATELADLSVSMDPYVSCVYKLVYETLVLYDDGEIKPCLAESWEWNDDNTELTFHLRQGVTFHDGEPFNAETAKAALEYNSKNPNNSFLKGMSGITQIDVVDEYTMKVYYDTPYFAALYDMSFADAAVILSPNCYEEGNYANLKSFIGTGPYKYGEFVKGEYTTFERNEDYWGEKPVWDTIVAKYVPDSASRLKALQTGEIDLIYGSSMLTYDDYEQAITIPGITGQVAEQNERTRNIVVNASGELCSDVNVRRAIAMSIDKQAIADGLTYGYEEVADRLFPEGTPHTDFELNNHWDYDPEEAGKLLDEAGWTLNESTGIREKDGTPLSLVFTYQSDVAINESIATAIKSQLAQVGIEAKLSGMEQMLWWQADMSGQFDLTIWNTNPAASVPQAYFSPWLDSAAGYAATSGLPEKEEIDEAINSYRVTADEEEVDEIFQYLINFSNDQVIDIPITYTKETIVYNSEKASDYQFFSYSEFFDILGLEPAE